MCKTLLFNNKKDNLENEIEELYFNSIKQVQQTDEYKDNELQIFCVKKALHEHSNAPDKLIDLLIEAVEEKVALEYESANKNIIKYVRKHI